MYERTKRIYLVSSVHVCVLHTQAMLLYCDFIEMFKPILLHTLSTFSLCVCACERSKTTHTHTRKWLTNIINQANLILWTALANVVARLPMPLVRFFVYSIQHVSLYMNCVYVLIAGHLLLHLRHCSVWHLCHSKRCSFWHRLNLATKRRRNKDSNCLFNKSNKNMTNNKIRNEYHCKIMPSLNLSIVL